MDATIEPAIKVKPANSDDEPQLEEMDAIEPASDPSQKKKKSQSSRKKAAPPETPESLAASSSANQPWSLAASSSSANQSQNPKAHLTDEPWLEEGFDRENPRILHYSYFKRCPSHLLPWWTVEHPDRGWICLPCNAQCQITHPGPKHDKKVARAKNDYNWFVEHLEHTGNLEIAEINDRI